MSDISLQVSTGLPDEQMHLREDYIYYSIIPSKTNTSIKPKIHQIGWEGGINDETFEDEDFVTKGEDDGWFA